MADLAPGEAAAPTPRTGPAREDATHAHATTEMGESAETNESADSAAGSEQSTISEDPAPRDTAFGLTPGDQVQHFTLLEKLGAGGMGVVYRARDEKLGRTVAVKLLRTESEHGAKRLLREAKALARLTHPNVVAVYEAGESDQSVYVAMEFVRGKTLRQWLEGDPPLGERLRVLAQAGEGLVAAHEQGLVHRDFKPDNVMVGDEGRVRVLDFGLAKRGVEDDLVEPVVVDPDDVHGSLVQLTKEGALVGTPAYMSPEQFRRDEIGPKADQFSFAAVLYEAVYGQRAFAGDNMVLIGVQVIGGNVREPPASSGVPPELHAALMRGLSVEPTERFVSLRELLDELERHLGVPPSAETESTGRFAAAAVVALAVVGGGVWWMTGGQGEEPAAQVQASEAPSLDEAAKQSAATHLEAAATAERNGDFEQALKEYRAAYAATPIASVQWSIGETLGKLERFEQAIASFEAYKAMPDRAEAADPDAEIDSLERAIAVRLVEKEEATKRAAEEAAAKETGEEAKKVARESKSKRGKQKNAKAPPPKGEPAKTEKEVEKKEETSGPTKEELAMAAYNKGTQAFNKAQYQKALGHFLDAQAHFPSADFHYNIAVCHENLKRWRSAIDAYNAYLRSDPRDAPRIRDKVAKIEERIAENQKKKGK